MAGVEIVIDGATLECSSGTAEGKLTVPDGGDKTISIGFIANMNDVGAECIPTFGICVKETEEIRKLLPNAADVPCVHNIKQPWVRTTGIYMVRGESAINVESITFCPKGGTITVVMSGQVGEGTVINNALLSLMKMFDLWDFVTKGNTDITKINLLNALMLADAHYSAKNSAQYLARQDNKFIDILDGHPWFSRPLLLLPDIQFPDSYREELIDRYRNGTLDARKTFLKYITSDSVNTGRYNPEKSMHYLSNTNQVYLNYLKDFNNKQGAGVTYFHEFGHFIDYNTGPNADRSIPNSVNDSQFAKLLREDFEDRLRSEAETLFNNTPGATFSTNPNDILNPANWCPEYQTLFNNIESQVRSNDASAVSDIYSGFGIVHGADNGKDVQIVGNYHHEVSYWDKRPDGVYTEAAAHFYEVQFDPNRKAIVESFFPNAMERYDEMLKEAAK